MLAFDFSDLERPRCLGSVWGNSMHFRMLILLCESPWLHSYLPSSFIPARHLNWTFLVWQVTKQSAKTPGPLFCFGFQKISKTSVYNRFIPKILEPLELRALELLEHSYTTGVPEFVKFKFGIFANFCFIFVNMGPYGIESFKRHLWKYTRYWLHQYIYQYIYQYVYP